MKYILILSIIFVYQLFAIEKNKISSYEIIAKEFYKQDTLYLVTRKFTMNEKLFFLVINTNTLETSIIEKKALHVKLLNISDNMWNSPFGKVLNKATSMVKTGGLTSQSSHNKNVVYLSMDMCPSSKSGYEKDFLAKITKIHSPFPIAVAITKKWVKYHEDDFRELLIREDLKITWINHSNTHFYDKNLPLKENFLLHSSTNIISEILEVEKMLLSYGKVPSIFFRYPGLIANKNLMKKLKNIFYLIPLGSNAWIAKGEKPKNGSIILIHGNKNEPRGITMILEQLPIISKSYKFENMIEAFR